MAENPYEAPKRRWYQFKLSTILVLVAIVAWAMALRPFIHLVYFGDSGREYVLSTGVPEGVGLWGIGIMLSSSSLIRQDHLQIAFGPDPQLLGPILALAAFLAWKWIAARRARRTGAT